MTPDLVGTVLDLAIKIGLILGPIFVAFYRKDRDALSRLIAAAPSIWNVVQQQKRKGEGFATANPLQAALDEARRVKGAPLTSTEAARMRIELQSISESMKVANQKALPVVARAVAAPGDLSSFHAGQSGPQRRASDVAIVIKP